MMESLTMSLGEKRNIAVCVRSTCDQAFDIDEASFFLKSGEEVEESGTCGITYINDTNAILTALIRPMRKNCNYTLEFHYTIDPEELIYVCRIRVE